LGELARRLERIVVNAMSPDGCIHATVRGRLELGMSFAPRAYQQYTEGELAHQLGQVATLTWTRFRREYLDVEREFLEWSVPQLDARDRLFQERAEQLSVEGSSPDGSVTARSRALARWEFHIAAGRLRELTEREFTAVALATADDTVRVYRAGRARLLDESYGLADGLPPWRRQPPDAGAPAGSAHRS
jgi:hypothetical protein